mmetsp:Transcript_28807/g.81151  ORF Transcript_28807/g.81151 Transcript_28807/m.81151 type:complete len:386 (-) Transcript_28807:76-1233(-)
MIATKPAAALLLPLLLIVALAGRGVASSRLCDYGSGPGVWEGERYRLLERDCTMIRYVDHIAGKSKQKEVAGDVLFVGDSLNRNVILDAGELLGAPAQDYTPIPYDNRGKPEKIGRNAMLRLGAFTAANLFHFGAHETENHWLGVARAGVRGMHNTTYGRVCLDGPGYLHKAGVKEDPYMIIINSNYWDAMHWSHTTVGPPPKNDKTKSFHISANEDAIFGLRGSPQRNGAPRPAWTGQVVEQKLDNSSVPELLARHVDAVRDLVDIVQRCYPGTKLFCWHTAPVVSTDSRNPHWFDKRPHVVAALNAAGRFVAKEKGLCLIDWDMMFQGRGSDVEWVPDGLHPAPHASREFLNVVLNVMMEHQGKHAGLMSNERALMRAMDIET